MALDGFDRGTGQGAGAHAHSLVTPGSWSRDPIDVMRRMALIGWLTSHNTADGRTPQIPLASALQRPGDPAAGLDVQNCMRLRLITDAVSGMMGPSDRNGLRLAHLTQETPMSHITYIARVRLSNGCSEYVTIQASGYFNAKAMLEATYGKGSVISLRSE